MRYIDQRWIEVTGAQEVFAHKSGQEMLDSYRKLKKEGKRVRFCTPNYKESFSVEQIPALGALGRWSLFIKVASFIANML